MHVERRRGKSRSRILYWFRTPPGVKVGRAALDEDALRQIEQLNPGIEFDWPRILKGQGAPSTEPRPPAAREREASWRQRPTGQRAPSAPVPPPAPAPAEPPTTSAIEPSAPVDIPASDPEPAAQGVESAAQVATHLGTPAHARLGDEGVQRLRVRYAEILARIAERVPDTARQDELKSTADRLNPDAWFTDADVVQGLEQYETVFAALREVVGRKRRRRRRSSDEPRDSSPLEPQGAPASRAPEAENVPESGPGSGPFEVGGTDDDGNDSGSGGV